MENISSRLKEKIGAALKSAFASALSSLPDGEQLLTPEVEQSTNAQFGHYQCNNALKLAKALKTSPREVAQKILSHFNTKLEDGSPMVEKAEIAGAGFINFTLDPAFLSKEADQMLRDSSLGVPHPPVKKRVVIDFSSPNVAKEMHVGHLRSTIIGDSLARLFEFLGHDVLRLNHIGDWGTQFGMLIVYMKDEVPAVLKGEQPAELSMLMDWYKKSKIRFDADPDFKKRAQQQVVLLQSGDPDSLKAWKMICAISRKGFQEIYDLLDVKLIERGESFYNPYLKPLVDDLTQKGLITISDGAKCIFMDGFLTSEGEPLPMIVQKADGGYNYDTTDLASIKYRIEVEKADRLIYVIDSGQGLHCRMFFKAAELAGYLDPKKVQADHVAFGVVLGADGKKFKTRSGETEKLIDLLREAIERAEKIIEERLPEISKEEKDALASALGIGAVKYSDLSCHRLKDYVFSYDRMLKFEGNTAAFLLYAYVRVQGIKRKVGKEIEKVVKNSRISLSHPSEIALALHLRQFGETLEMIERELLPNRLTEYLYSLADKFNAFFRDCRVEGTPEEDSRLLLCEASARILKTGLNILGLQTVERM
ncbi:MAG: arginine--tRNA ligase [Chlamydiales bacterium]|nr:arginine--tRNA ligase [Chlamydiales bacterium]